MKNYQGSAFKREQLVLVAELILVSALDRIESCTPTGGTTDWQDRLALVNQVHNDGVKLTAYESGAVETAGMALAVLYAQLTDDGLGIGDALHCADRFDDACGNWIAAVWGDQGVAVRAKIKQLGPGGWTVGDAYTNYPDCRKHAEAFVDECFAEYLSPFSDRGYERDDGSVVLFPEVTLKGTICIVDDTGSTVDRVHIGDPDWKELRDLFPDDQLYFQPDKAGDPECPTNAKFINSYDVWRFLDKCHYHYGSGKILAFTGDDIEKPTFKDAAYLGRPIWWGDPNNVPED
jgi:hypothetical protein